MPAMPAMPTTCFSRRGHVAIGWDAMGDLSLLRGDREAFREKYVQAYPEAKKGGIATVSSAPFRFLHEMKVGDLIVYPSKQDKLVHIGRVAEATSTRRTVRIAILTTAGWSG